MTSSRLQSLRDRIAQDANAANVELPPAESEPMTKNGTRRGNASLDTPPPGEGLSSLIVEGPRSCKLASRASQYHEERAEARSQSATREYNKSLKQARAAQQATESTAELTDADGKNTPASKRGRRLSKSGGRRSKPSSQSRGRNTAPKTGDGGRTSNAKKRPSASSSKGRVRVRNVHEAEEEERSRMRRDLRDLPRSPTPGSTDQEEGEDNDQRKAQQSESQYTYIEETAGYETLAAFARGHLGQSFEGWENEDIQTALEMAEEDEADSVQAPRPETEIVMLEASGSRRVSGGWVNQSNATLATNLGKRAAAGEPAGSSVKRIRTRDPNDTATESESDDEPVVATNQSGSPPRPPPPAPTLSPEASQPPTAVLERERAAATVLEVPLEGQPPSTSPSLGGQPSHLPTLPNFLSNVIPIRGPIHERLKRKVLARDYEGDVVMRDASPSPVEQRDESSDAQATSAPPPSSSPVSPLPPQPAPPPSPVEPTPSTHIPTSRVKRTYGRDRTHAGPGDKAPAPDRPDSPTTVEPPARHRSSASRSILELVEEESNSRGGRPSRSTMKAARAEARARARLWAPALGRTNEKPSGRGTAPFSAGSQSQSQSRSRTQLKSQSQIRNRSQKSTRPLHPAAAAEADLAAFNERCARNNAPSFVESVTRQTSRAPRVAISGPRDLNELLSDHDEDYAHAEALQEGKQPNGGRKKKPLARDIHGHRRQVLTYAKIHLFAYILVEGAYQTRGTYMIWAARVHEATWHALYPDLPYRAATLEELEIMVNYIATLRGKTKEKLRSIIEIVYEFDGRIVTQDDIWANLDRFNEIHPNTFHCTSYRPRRGHYKSEHIARCIAAALFQGPNSVGVLYPDYFEDMPLTVVAFVLAMMQFCIEEWQTGYWVNRDLGAAKMLDKYESHLAGLKGLQAVAPARTAKLQRGWSNYAFDYCGASFIDESKDREEALLHSEFRPDTPPPEAPSESSRPRSLRVLAPETSPVFLEDEYSRDEAPEYNETRSPLPDAEYNEHGYRTAHSKRKGRAD
ncbi:hypothetical protein RhiJN_07837 [Ceratobasidium sp. AG-Ba]|nr:hypothetical protein RhiJN_07837 [Ceratobasidium sp. AG-Ba]QRW08652.1 hypothetical protein RhiLY_07651 [Ceratobasidium sp. AG-Ba]